MMQKLTVVAAFAALAAAPAAAVVGLSSAETVAGIVAPIEVERDAVYVTGAKVVTPDPCPFRARQLLFFGGTRRRGPSPSQRVGLEELNRLLRTLRRTSYRLP